MTGNLPLLQAPPGPSRPLAWRWDLLLPAAALALAVLAGLLWYGLALWKALAWALSFGAALPLALSPSPQTAARLRWGAFALGPLLAFLLVEQMNYNYQVW